jgi:S-adenosylmethionine hydrolase
MTRPIITLVTDFGPAAPAVCRGVMLGIAPDANIIDVNHVVPRYSIRGGSRTLVFALPYMPVGIHVAVVDPGVGTSRLPIAIRVERGDILIGPDNGLLIAAAEKLGGIREVRAIENRELMLAKISSSFHGRDIFSPVAAHLAMGTPFESVGSNVDASALVRLPEPRPVVNAAERRLDTVVVDIQIYGNVIFAGEPADLEAAIGPLEDGRRITVEFPATKDHPSVIETTRWGITFGSVPVGYSVLMADSEGQLSLADNQGIAAMRLGLMGERPTIIRG